MVDAETGDGLPYAHLQLKTSNLGTVANSLGEFKLIFSNELLNDSLLVSYIGYRVERFHLAALREEVNLKIRLDPEEITLEEVEISGERLSILDEAVAAIPQNYDFGELKASGFFRAWARNDSVAIQLSETAFDVYRTRPKAKPEDLFDVTQARVARDSAAFATILNMYAGITPSTVFALLFPVKAPLVEQKGFRKDHDFVVRRLIYLGRPTYSVAFDQKEGSRKVGYRGEFLIDEETLAFTRITYDYSPQSYDREPLLDGSMALAHVLGMQRSKYVGRRSEIHYTKRGGKWYLDFVDFAAGFRFVKRNGNIHKIDYEAELVLTNVAHEDYATPEDLDFRKNRLLEQQGASAGPDFWSEYNYILPDQDFDKMYDDIRRRGKDRAKADR